MQDECHDESSIDITKPIRREAMRELEDIQFVDCGPTIKEEIKEENVEFHDPLRLSYAVQSLDEPVTYEEFFV